MITSTKFETNLKTCQKLQKYLKQLAIHVLTNSNLTLIYVFMVAIHTSSTHCIVIFARYLVSSTFHAPSYWLYNCTDIIVTVDEEFSNCKMVDYYVNYTYYYYRYRSAQYGKKKKTRNDRRELKPNSAEIALTPLHRNKDVKRTQWLTRSAGQLEIV